MDESPQVKEKLITPGLIAIFLFTLCYMVIAFVTSVNLKNTEFLFYFIVMCLLIAGVTFIHSKVRLHIMALWGLSIWGMMHMAGGLMKIPESWPIHGETHVLYNWWIIPNYLKYDQFVHAYGFGLTTWICWMSLKGAFKNRDVVIGPTFGLMVLCTAAGMGFGAMNEVVEFIATLMIPGTNVGGYNNTGWDLISNLTGSVISACLIYAFDSPDRKLS